MIICNEGRLVFWGFAGCFQPLGKHRLFLKASQDPHDFSEGENFEYQNPRTELSERMEFCDVSNFQARFPGLQYFVPWKGMAKEVGGCESMDGRKMKHHMLCDCVCIQSVCDRCDRCTYEKLKHSIILGLWAPFSVWLYYGLASLPRQISQSCSAKLHRWTYQWSHRWRQQTSLLVILVL